MYIGSCSRFLRSGRECETLRSPNQRSTQRSIALQYHILSLRFLLPFPLLSLCTLLEFVSTARETGLPNGQLPVLDVDGFRLAQSLAILRYVGKLGGESSHSTTACCVEFVSRPGASDAASTFFPHRRGNARIFPAGGTTLTQPPQTITRQCHRTKLPCKPSWIPNRLNPALLCDMSFPVGREGNIIFLQSTQLADGSVDGVVW